MHIYNKSSAHSRLQRSGDHAGVQGLCRHSGEIRLPAFFGKADDQEGRVFHENPMSRFERLRVQIIGEVQHEGASAGDLTWLESGHLHIPAGRDGGHRHDLRLPVAIPVPIRFGA